MNLDLEKWVSLDLSKTAPSLKNVRVWLGWDVVSGVTIDLDVAAIVLENGEKSTKKSGNICFFNALKILNGAIYHTWDNRTGEGEGDDESIVVNLEQVSKELPNISEIHFPVFIY